MVVLRWLLGLVLMVFTLAFFAYVEIYLFIVGGASDFLSGWDAIPQNFTTMAWGFIEIYGLGGIGFIVTGFLLFLSLEFFGI